MKSTKEMQLLSNAQVAKGASDILNKVNTNPTYVMRRINKFCTGKDGDFNDIIKEGLSKQELCEQFNRLNEVFGCGGYWWGSIIAREGRLITAARKVEIVDDCGDAESVKGLYCGKDDFVFTEVYNGVLYSFRAASVWNYSNVVASAKLALRFAEEAATKSGNLYSWMRTQAEAKRVTKEAQKEEAKRRRKAQSEAKKAEKKKMNDLAKSIEALRFAVAAGLVTDADAHAQVMEILAA